ncbi:YkgJ family cysteine cluster protein [Desulfoscipio sp. XC116]|uniref:YkgJ family cysteine cluster protein n=1 Tax=Desulfoscipio sp. XC116 TaxID=3144975 RepID=UPI00325B19ED
MVLDFQRGIADKLANDTLEQLNMEDSFTFACGPDCMGRCCQNITILLDPWDVEVMARHLNLPGQRFFKDYCAMEPDRDTGWPAVWLAHAANGRCAFMLEDGRCSIYRSRSRNCRTFPLGRAVRYHRDGDVCTKEDCIFMVDREHMQFCLGHTADRVWTVQEWYDDAGAEDYYRMSDQYTELVDYAARVLQCREWMSPKIMQMLMPFLFAPDLLRVKLGISEKQIDHREFHRRRMEAVKLILTDVALGCGCGPQTDVGAAAFAGSLMDRVKKVMTAGA